MIRFAGCWKEASLVGLRYVRYGANALIGVKGSRDDCERVERDLQHFLKSDLRLDRKNLIFRDACATTPDKEYTVFLGAEIYVAQQISPPGPNPRSKEAGELLQAPRICVPARLLLAKLEDYGFTDKWKKKPTFCGRVVNWEPHEIVRFYDITAKMFQTYYSFADNYHSLSLLFDILRQSCALSLGKKLSLKRLWLVTKKFGKNLEIRGEGDEVLAAMYKPRFGRPREPFSGWDINPFKRIERPSKPKFPPSLGKPKLEVTA